MPHDIPADALEAAGRALFPIGWDVPAERAAHIDSIRRGLAAAMPALRRHIADKIEAEEQRAVASGGAWDYTRGMAAAARVVRGDDNA